MATNVIIPHHQILNGPIYLLGSASTVVQANGAGTAFSQAGQYNGNQSVYLQNSSAGGTATVTILGSFDGTIWLPVGYQQIDNISGIFRSTTPIAVGTSGAIPAAPAATLSLTTSTTGGALGSGVYKYEVTYIDAQGREGAVSTFASITTGAGTTNSNSLSNIPTGDASILARNIYRTAVGGSTYHLVTSLSDNSTTSYTDTASDASISGAATPPATTTQNWAHSFQLLDLYSQLRCYVTNQTGTWGASLGITAQWFGIAI